MDCNIQQNQWFEICLEACKAAKEMNVKISCDLNYRNKLWSKAKAGEVIGLDILADGLVVAFVLLELAVALHDEDPYIAEKE